MKCLQYQDSLGISSCTLISACGLIGVSYRFGICGLHQPWIRAAGLTGLQAGGRQAADLEPLYRSTGSQLARPCSEVLVCSPARNTIGMHREFSPTNGQFACPFAAQRSRQSATRVVKYPPGVPVVAATRWERR